MKVLMIVPNLLIGGLETMVLNLCLELRRQSTTDVRVFAYDWNETGLNLLAKFQEAKISCEIFKKGPGFSMKAVQALRRAVHSFQPDVIHSHDLGPLLYSRLALLGMNRKPRHVHTQHTLQHLHGHWRQNLYDRFLILGLDHLVGVSADVVNTYLTRGINKNKLSLISNGVNFPDTEFESSALRLSLLNEVLNERERNKLSECLNDRWLLSLSRVDERKGQLDLIKIWNETSAEFRRNRCLLIVGPEARPGQLDRLTNAMHAARSPEKIIYAGASLKAGDWFQASDVFLSASCHEGMPLAPIEALGSGLPVLLSRIPGHTFLSSYPGVDLFDAHDAKTAAQVWMQAETQPLSRSKLRSQTHDLRLNHGLTAMAEKYAHLYKRLAQQGAS